MSKRDPQAKILYKMEDSFMRGNLTASVSLEKLQALADKVCRRWGVPPVKVLFKKNRYWYGSYFGARQVIELYDHKKRKLKGHGRNVPVLLHELAHHIDAFKLDPVAPAHGPNFAAICLDLYDHYEILPADAYRVLARRYGVKIARGIHHKMRKRRTARRG